MIISGGKPQRLTAILMTYYPEYILHPSDLLSHFGVPSYPSELW